MGIDVSDTDEDLIHGLREAEVIYHLAGVNRPSDPAEFLTVNTGLTERICVLLERLGRPVAAGPGHSRRGTGRTP